MNPEPEPEPEATEPISQEEYERKEILTAIEVWDSEGDGGISQVIPQIPQRSNGFVGYDHYIIFLKAAMVLETALLLVVIYILLFV
jgi:hypothetical protein